MKRTTAPLVTVAAVAALLLAGCSGSDDDATGTEPTATPSSSATSATTADDGVVVPITITGGKVTPQGKRVEVEVGENVTLQITSDTDEEVHVHSDPEHTYEIAPGDEVSESFTIDTPGQVAVEAHHADVTIVQLVVRP